MVFSFGEIIRKIRRPVPETGFEKTIAGSDSSGGFGSFGRVHGIGNVPGRAVIHFFAVVVIRLEREECADPHLIFPRLRDRKIVGEPSGIDYGASVGIFRLECQPVFVLHRRKFRKFFAFDHQMISRFLFNENRKENQ